MFLTSSEPSCGGGERRQHWRNWSTDWSSDQIDQHKKLIKRTRVWSALWSFLQIKALDFNDLKNPSCFQILWSVKERMIRRKQERWGNFTRGTLLFKHGTPHLFSSPPWDEGPQFHLLSNANGREGNVGGRSEGTTLSNLTLLLPKLRNIQFFRKKICKWPLR